MPPTRPASRPSVARRLWREAPWVVALAAGAVAAGLGWIARYRLVEPEALGALCRSAAAPIWCPARTALIVAAEWNGVGLTALGLTAALLLTRRRRRGLGMAALAFAGAALFLYNATAGAVASVVSLVALAAAGDEAGQPRGFGPEG